MVPISVSMSIVWEKRVKGRYFAHNECLISSDAYVIFSDVSSSNKLGLLSFILLIMQ